MDMFEKIGEPHIAIEISKGGLVDPLTPFGLQTTFKEAEKFTPPAKLTREQANEDFDFFIESIRECYPSLRDIITPEREAEFVRDCKARLDSAEVSFTTLYDIVGDAFNAELERKNNSSDKPYLLDASIGHITSVPEESDTLLEFIQQADAEMYQVKKTKKNHR